MSRTTEIELKYRFKSSDDSLWQSLPNLEWLDYPGLSQPAEKAKLQVIQDTYWDLADGQLFQNGFYIRSRTKNDKELFTLKGPAQTQAGSESYTARLEIEGPASQETWQKILGELKPAFSDSDFLQLNKPPGQNPNLQTFQPRTNHRYKRNVNLGSGLLEFAFDEVTFPINDLKIQHRELEVEVVDSVSDAELLELDKKISSLDFFVPFALSKVLVGMALEDFLAKDFQPEQLMGNNLTESGYERLARLGNEIKKQASF